MSMKQKVLIFCFYHRTDFGFGEQNLEIRQLLYCTSTKMGRSLGMILSTAMAGSYGHRFPLSLLSHPQLQVWLL